MHPDSREPDFETLDGWLRYLERVHPRSIEMGLERVKRVKDALRLNPGFPVIVVGGTNGKGSVCTMLEAILSRAGYRVACYTSPHLLRYNERVRINRCEATDAALCGAFAAVEAARAGIPLTYFEFGTLAAMQMFVQDGVEAAILEVGLGGRLDAVNAFDNDCAVITSVALDHMDYLGHTREAIGFEKAGTFRRGKAAVCGDPNPPETVHQHAEDLGCDLLQIGSDYGYSAEKLQWDYWSRYSKRHGLPPPALRGAYQLQNAATVLAVLDELADRLPVAMGDVRAGLLEAELPARFQVLPGRPAVVLDVAHNPHAAAGLASNLAAMGFYRATYAVFAMLRDKDAAGVIHAVKDRVDFWMVAGLAGDRGAGARETADALGAAGVPAGAVRTFGTPAEAYAAACIEAGENDRIIVFGSFHTVADVLRERERRTGGKTRHGESRQR
ncbi:MAG: bifunctional tetrahydrofolate synthase/dihydrofolate synthase [Betaproteobacteria bacterium]|nr:bifunctional tetrahydrofolate synthase/dihydrofolate synthase [Betaproteobacteria bacterium]